MPTTKAQLKISEGQSCHVFDDRGSLVPNPESYTRTMTYNGDGTLATEYFELVMSDGTFRWTRTYGYTAGNLTSISRWTVSET